MRSEALSIIFSLYGLLGVYLIYIYEQPIPGLFSEGEYGEKRFWIQIEILVEMHTGLRCTLLGYYFLLTCYVAC